jgi:hypothetical protein
VASESDCWAQVRAAVRSARRSKAAQFGTGRKHFFASRNLDYNSRTDTRPAGRLESKPSAEVGNFSDIASDLRVICFHPALARLTAISFVLAGCIHEQRLAVCRGMDLFDGQRLRVRH